MEEAENINFNQPLSQGFISLDLFDENDLKLYNQFLQRKDIQIVKEVEKYVPGYVDKHFIIPEQKIKFINYIYLNKRRENSYPVIPNSYGGYEIKISLN